MTCIVGFVDKKNKNVVIGGDSAGVSGYDIVTRKDPKVFKNGDFLIGCTSSFRMIQLLRYSFKPPKIGKKEFYHYMCTDFVDAIRACFSSGGWIQKTTDGSEQGGVFLIGYKDRLFNIQSDFQVGENLNGIDACGCGERYALGAMFSMLNTEIEAKRKIEIALESATYFSAGVCGPYIIETT